MASVFTVSVDISKLHLTMASFPYHVFVDPSQMGIVLEFMELVRYLWDLKNPVILSHNNAYIHYLEDIRILSLFKNVEIEYFTPSNTEIDRMNNLLEKLKFYDSSMGEKIPRVIHSRFDKNVEGRKKTDGLTDLNHSEPPVYNVADPLSTDLRYQKLKKLSRAELHSWNTPGKQAVSTIPFISKNQSINSPKIENGKKLNETNINIMGSPSESGSQRNLQRRRSQNFKPFSLGAMLSTLRSSSSQEENPSPQDKTQINLDTSKENELQDEDNLSSNADSGKKRKRIRKHKSRKRKQNGSISTPFDFNPAIVLQVNPAVSSLPTTSNSTHVRFAKEELEDEDEYEYETKIEYSSNENLKETVTLESKNEGSEKPDSNIFEQTPVTEVTLTEFDNADLDKNNLTRRVIQIREETENGLDREVDESKSLQVDQLKALFSFKSKNVSPVAHRRVIQIVD